MRIVKLEAGSAVAGVDLDALPCCTFTTVSTFPYTRGILTESAIQTQKGRLTTIVRSPNHINTPRKRRPQVKLHIRPVDKRLARVVCVGAQHSIVEARARVVRVDVEVVVGVAVAGGFEVEFLGGDGGGVAGAGDEGGCCGSDGQQSRGERGEKFHFVFAWLLVY